jgi:radical SAM-linked protein
VSLDGGPGKLRLRYAKLGRIRFTSQRDVARMWERALRRSGLPVAWSEGFSPRPLLSFGLALPTGAESLGEYLDVRLDQGGEGASRADVGLRGDDLAGLTERLSDLLPEGITVQVAALFPHDAGSLQQEVSSCVWELEVLGVTAEELTTRVEHLLGASSVVIRRERKGRAVEDDLRPAVRTLTPMAGGVDGSAYGSSACRLRTELATRPRGVRPGELLEGLGADLVLARACRTHQWIERDGARWEPLGTGGEEPGAVAPHAQERAS